MLKHKSDKNTAHTLTAAATQICLRLSHASEHHTSQDSALIRQPAKPTCRACPHRRIRTKTWRLPVLFFSRQTSIARPGQTRVKTARPASFQGPSVPPLPFHNITHLADGSRQVSDCALIRHSTSGGEVRAHTRKGTHVMGTCAHPRHDPTPRTQACPHAHVRASAPTCTQAYPHACKHAHMPMAQPKKRHGCLRTHSNHPKIYTSPC